MDPEANPIRGPPQPPSWKLPEGSDFPDVSDDDSDSDEANASNSNNNSNGDRPVSLSETRKEMEEKMEKKVSLDDDGTGCRETEGEEEGGRRRGRFFSVVPIKTLPARVASLPVSFR